MNEEKAEIKDLLNLMQTAASQFQSGDDAAGIDDLLAAEKALVNLVEADQISQRSRIDLSRLLPFLRGLYFYVHNQDIAGVSDFLEDTLCPLTDQWRREG